MGTDPDRARIVIAPDSLKGTLDAAAAADALAAGWRAERPDDELLTVPLADGGEGTLDALGHDLPASCWRTAPVTGPDGRPVEAAWLLLPDGTAVVEMARAAGLPLLERPDRVDLTGLTPPPPGGVQCLVDVTAPLLGPLGAAGQFGPQKGASPAQVAELDAALARLADLLGGDREAPGAGAAGGTAYGFAAAWGAQFVSGATA